MSCVPSYVLATCKFATCRPIWYLRTRQHYPSSPHLRQWLILGEISSTHSSLQALPPSISNNTRLCARAEPQLLRFIILTISGFHLPWSLSRPSWSDPRSPKVDAVEASAIFLATSWKLARGRENCFLNGRVSHSFTRAAVQEDCRAFPRWDLYTHRSSEYSRALATQSSSAPITPQLIPYLALFKHENGDPSPLDFGSKASSGSLTSSRKTEPVMLARRASLFFMAVVDRPWVSCRDQVALQLGAG